MINFFKAIFRIISQIISIIILAIIVVFCVNNHQTITLSLTPLPFEIETRVFLAILFSFFSGIFIGFLCSFGSLTKERFKHYFDSLKIKSLQKRIEKQNQREVKKATEKHS